MVRRLGIDSLSSGYCLEVQWKRRVSSDAFAIAQGRTCEANKRRAKERAARRSNQERCRAMQSNVGAMQSKVGRNRWQGCDELELTAHKLYKHRIADCANARSDVHRGFELFECVRETWALSNHARTRPSIVGRKCAEVDIRMPAHWSPREPMTRSTAVPRLSLRDAIEQFGDTSSRIGWELPDDAQRVSITGLRGWGRKTVMFLEPRQFGTTKHRPRAQLLECEEVRSSWAATEQQWPQV